jgi:uncharacterized membrane protein
MMSKTLPWFASALSFGLAASALFADPPSYSKDVQPFLTRYCVQCHGSAKPKAGVRFDSFEGMMEKSKRRTVVPGQPDQSRLIAVLSGRGRMMPPKNYTPRPTPEEIDQLKAWIKAGAKSDTQTSESAQVLEVSRIESLSDPAKKEAAP